MQGCVQLAYPFASDFIGFASRCRSGLKPCGESTMSSLILNINGAKMPVDAPGDETLLSVLRNRLALTGTKYGCGEGECGACTVLLDGKAVKSCQTLVSEAAGARITTIEGLEQNGQAHSGAASLPRRRRLPVRLLHLRHGHARHRAAGNATPRPTQAQIVARMNGNICRCGTYPRIVDAVQRASMSMTKGGAR
jgi:isoquinoline 1-oxidoreductase alpha subunit